MVVDAVVIDNDDSEFHRALIYLSMAALTTAVFSALRGSIFTLCIARFKVR